MRKPLRAAALGLIVLASSPTLRAEDDRPVITEFQFSPTAIRFGDTVRYQFTYRNLPGGLAAVRDVEMWVQWQAVGYQPVRSRFGPTTDELAAHPAEGGVFRSRELTWTPPEQAPRGGIDITYTLILKTRDGTTVQGTAKVRYQ